MRYIDADIPEDDRQVFGFFYNYDLQQLLDSRPTVDAVSVGHCSDCERNADNGGTYKDGKTKCPIQEHYALLKDGFCHLYSPIKRC